ncbi:hypothetical protein B0H16DRAFT_1467117 [Mycena metata]|uniref:Uncharacterized protein n=1 Tax=Mycena metata TaxID=1033252 RepID=A0AAD7MXT4_9AGAR|nr:hypothetical protein B0H16DRAFT_1467117 [Mycena metata]
MSPQSAPRLEEARLGADPVALRLEHAWMVLARRVQALTVIAEHAKPFDAIDTFGDERAFHGAFNVLGCAAGEACGTDHCNGLQSDDQRPKRYGDGVGDREVRDAEMLRSNAGRETPDGARRRDRTCWDEKARRVGRQIQYKHSFGYRYRCYTSVLIFFILSEGIEGSAAAGMEWNNAALQPHEWKRSVAKWLVRRKSPRDIHS